MLKKTHISELQLNNYVHSICRDIAKDNWRPDYIVGLTRGGLIPAVMISQYFDIPMHTLRISLRDDTENGSESNLWMAEDAYGADYCGTFDNTPIFNEIKQKNILIVDDINDTGATLNWLNKDWESSCLPNSPHWKTVWENNVRFAVLVDNLASNAIVKTQYTGIEINKAENPEWIVFPWESWFDNRQINNRNMFDGYQQLEIDYGSNY